VDDQLVVQLDSFHHHQVFSVHQRGIYDQIDKFTFLGSNTHGEDRKGSQSFNSHTELRPIKGTGAHRHKFDLSGLKIEHLCQLAHTLEHDNLQLLVSLGS